MLHYDHLWLLNLLDVAGVAGLLLGRMANLDLGES